MHVLSSSLYKYDALLIWMDYVLQSRKCVFILSHSPFMSNTLCSFSSTIRLSGKSE